MRPDILFLDLAARSGPAYSALDLARALHRHPLCQNLIIVGILSQGTTAERTLATAAGCRDFLPSPVLTKQIEEAIHRQFRRKAS